MCYTKWEFDTWAAIGQYTTHSFISVPAEKQYWQISFSLCFLLYSIEEVTIASAVLGWSLEWGNCRWGASQAYGHYKSSHYSHGHSQARAPMGAAHTRAAAANQSRAAKTAYQAILSLWASLYSFLHCSGLMTTWVPSIQGTPQLCAAFFNQSQPWRSVILVNS